MRKIYWYFTSYVHKYGLLLIITLVGGILVFSVIVPSILSRIEKHSAKYIGIIGQYPLQRLPESITNQLSVGLTQINADDTIAPVLAERWTVEQDGTNYRFVLKENLDWQDGTPFSTENIQFYLPNVETIITPRDIVFKLPTAYERFPSVVATPLFKEGVITKWKLFRKPTLVGIGSEYKIVDYTKKNKSDNLSQLIVENKSERFVYRFYLTEKDAITAFQRGEIDQVQDLAKIWPIMKWNSVATIASLHPDQYSAVFFNHRNPLFTKNIRQALSYATTKTSPERRAISPINSLSWAYFPGSKTYDTDTERAIERLLEELPREKLAFSLVTTTLFESQATQIQSEWEALGKLAVDRCNQSSQVQDKTICPNLAITVSLRIANFPDTTNFDTILIGQESPPDPDQYELWHSNEPTNFSGYKNTRIDNLLEKGRQTSDRGERIQLYQEFQQFLTEDAAAIFLEHLTNYRIERM